MVCLLQSWGGKQGELNQTEQPSPFPHSLRATFHVLGLPAALFLALSDRMATYLLQQRTFSVHLCSESRLTSDVSFCCSVDRTALALRFDDLRPQLPPGQ